MTRPNGFRFMCVALGAALLAFPSAPASADSRDHGFASTANSIINLLDSPETPAPQKSQHAPHAVARPHGQHRNRPVAVAKPRAAKPQKIASKSQPSKPQSQPQPRPVIASRPQPVAVPKAQPAPVVASRPMILARPVVPIAVARPAVHEKPRHVVALSAPPRAHKHARHARAGAIMGHGIPIVKPWGGKIPDNYCDLPTGCASPAPVPEDHITY